MFERLVGESFSLYVVPSRRLRLPAALLPSPNGLRPSSRTVYLPAAEVGLKRSSLCLPCRSLLCPSLALFSPLPRGVGVSRDLIKDLNFKIVLY